MPGSWRNLAYPSLRPLGSWLQNLLQRVTQLVEWTADLVGALRLRLCVCVSVRVRVRVRVW